MNIILRNKSCSNLKKIFSNKAELLSNIDNDRFYNLSENYEDYRKRENLPSDYHKWNIYELVRYFYNDYEIFNI